MFYGDFRNEHKLEVPELTTGKINLDFWTFDELYLIRVCSQLVSTGATLSRHLEFKFSRLDEKYI